jgi:hypothetical protein
MTHQGVLARMCLAVMLAGGISSIDVDAGASVVPAGHGGGWSGNGSGNGRHNRNSFIINSPSESRDVQHIRNVNVGGKTITPAALCKHAVRCRIVQRIVVDP